MLNSVRRLTTTKRSLICSAQPRRHSELTTSWLIRRRLHHRRGKQGNRVRGEQVRTSLFPLFLFATYPVTLFPLFLFATSLFPLFLFATSPVTLFPLFLFATSPVTLFPPPPGLFSSPFHPSPLNSIPLEDFRHDNHLQRSCKHSRSLRISCMGR